MSSIESPVILSTATLHAHTRSLLFPIPAFRDITRAVLSLGSCVTRLVVGHSLLVCDRWSFVACPWRPLPTLRLSRFLPKPRSARYLTVPGKTRSCPQSVLYTTHLTKKTGTPPLVLAPMLLQLLLPRWWALQTAGSNLLTDSALLVDLTMRIVSLPPFNPPSPLLPPLLRPPLPTPLHSPNRRHTCRSAMTAPCPVTFLQTFDPDRMVTVSLPTQPRRLRLLPFRTTLSCPLRTG